MKKTFILLAAIAVLAVIYFVVTRNSVNEDTENIQSSTYTSDVSMFAAADGQFTIQYNDDASKAQIIYNDTPYELEQSVSASGARYESADGAVLFWEHQGEATFEINGTPVFREPAKLICDDRDQDCVDPNGQTTKLGDPIPDIDITLGQAGAGDDDSDGDGYGDAALVGYTWVWTGTLDNAGEVVVAPQKNNAFTLTFATDKSVSVTTDCNNASGSYTASDMTLKFSSLASTRMACLDSQEGEFTQMLQEVDKFSVAEAGQRTLKLQLTNGNTMMFMAVPAGMTLDHDEIIGMTEDEAIAYAEKSKVPFRVIKRDDEVMIVTADYRLGRINAEVADGVVTSYKIEL